MQRAEARSAQRWSQNASEFHEPEVDVFTSGADQVTGKTTSGIITSLIRKTTRSSFYLYVCCHKGQGDGGLRPIGRAFEPEFAT